MTDPLPALRQAAAALLAEAPMPVVRGMLRALLADTEAPPRADAPASPEQPQRPEPKPAPAPGTKPAPASGRVRTPPTPDEAWDTRRVQIRAAMQDRGVSYPALAAKFGVKVPTLKHALSRRQPPGPAMRKRLDGWMKSSAPAPAVAEPAPFRRPNGASGPHADAGRSRTVAGAAAAAD